MWCTSMWLGGVLAFVAYRWPRSRRFMLAPALSAAVGLLSTLDSYLGSNVDDTPLSDPADIQHWLTGKR